MRETGNDLIRPATVDLRTTSGAVLKNRIAMIEISSHPAVPLMSAGFFQMISMHRISMIGNKVRIRDCTVHIFCFTSVSLNILYDIWNTSVVHLVLNNYVHFTWYFQKNKGV